MTATDFRLETSAGAKRRPYKWPIFGACLLALASGFVLQGDVSDTLEIWGYWLRVTARVAFVFLMLAFIARPLVQLFGRGKTLLRHRRYLGLSMAFAHTVHAVFVVLVLAAQPEPLDFVVIVLGGGAFITMWCMAATSNDRSMRKLGKRWGYLHTFGMYYLFIVFMQSFAGRIGAQDPLDHYLYLALTLFGLAGLVLRVWAAVERRKRKAARAAAA